MEKTGKLIVLEGLDGSGKATQTAILAQRMNREGLRVRTVSFPDYENKSSTLVRMYLGGEIGGLEEVNPWAVSGFYAADRYISWQTGWKSDYESGALILADRYTTSNAVHQMAGLPREEWDSYLAWLWDYEFTKMKLPAPDIVFYLDMHPETSRRLLEKRYREEGGAPDLHEGNYAYLLRCRETALYAAEHTSWRVVRCCDGSEPLPPDKIADTIWKQALTIIAKDRKD